MGGVADGGVGGPPTKDPPRTEACAQYFANVLPIAVELPSPGLQNLGVGNALLGFEIGRVRTGCLVLTEKAQYLHTPF